MKKKHEKEWLSILAILLAIYLAACGEVIQPEATALVDTPAASKTVLIQPTSSVAEAIPPQGSPTSEVSNGTPTALPPTPRPNLQASAPDSYVQASGQVQLVEFFAFW